MLEAEKVVKHFIASNTRLFFAATSEFFEIVFVHFVRLKNLHAYYLKNKIGLDTYT